MAEDTRNRPRPKSSGSDRKSGDNSTNQLQQASASAKRRRSKRNNTRAKRKQIEDRKTATADMKIAINATQRLTAPSLNNNETKGSETRRQQLIVEDKANIVALTQAATPTTDIKTLDKHVGSANSEILSKKIDSVVLHSHDLPDVSSSNLDGTESTSDSASSLKHVGSAKNRNTINEIVLHSHVSTAVNATFSTTKTLFNLENKNVSIPKLAKITLFALDLADETTAFKPNTQQTKSHNSTTTKAQQDNDNELFKEIGAELKQWSELEALQREPLAQMKLTLTVKTEKDAKTGKDKLLNLPTDLQRRYGVKTANVSGFGLMCHVMLGLGWEPGNCKVRNQLRISEHLADCDGSRVVDTLKRLLALPNRCAVIKAAELALQRVTNLSYMVNHLSSDPMAMPLATLEETNSELEMMRDWHDDGDDYSEDGQNWDSDLDQGFDDD
jgi:hypothetical protein